MIRHWITSPFVRLEMNWNLLRILGNLACLIPPMYVLFISFFHFLFSLRYIIQVLDWKTLLYVDASLWGELLSMDDLLRLASVNKSFAAHLSPLISFLISPINCMLWPFEYIIKVLVFTTSIHIFVLFTYEINTCEEFSPLTKQCATYNLWWKYVLTQE